MKLIALTTDFGPSSHYVAQMKGVILSRLPEARIVDITHAVAPQSVRHAETILRSSIFSMPIGAVHVVVVDPGVGTDRRPIAIEARGMKLVGPDNGVLGVALQQPNARVVVLDRPELFSHPVSNTFHGRDIFAPVAAELAGGLTLTEVGTLVDDAAPSTLPVAEIEEGRRVAGETLLADHFGNLLTNIPARAVESLTGNIRVGDTRATWVDTYGHAPADTLLALEGSDGFVEIAIREGSALASLKTANLAVIFSQE